MVNFIHRTLILLLSFTLLGCESKGPYKIEEDKMIADLAAEVKLIEEARNKMKEDMEKAEKVAKEPDLDTELRESIQTELFQAKYWQVKMFEHIANYKIKIRRRKARLEDRKKKGIDQHEIANKEVREYFQNKKLYPLEKGWENRHKAAIDL